MADILFVGEVLPFGGLSNEAELGAAVPDDFGYGNPWTDFTQVVFFDGAEVTDWRFRDEDPEVRGDRLSKFQALINGLGLEHEVRMSVGGWMLSEILTEVPELTPQQHASE